MFMPHAVDFYPCPVVSVDGRGIGFVGLEFHGLAKVGGAQLEVKLWKLRRMGSRNVVKL
jgi:phosphopantothenate synthetase